MLAVDTNVVTRLIADDDPDQVATARLLLAAGPIWVSTTVLLETNWVLRRAYNFGTSEIREAFTRLLGTHNVHTEDKAAVASALSLTLHGIEFADALHFTCRPTAAEFVTFDRTLINRAKRAGVAGISDAATYLSR
jgi:predicted nucleic-acid-binding protein